MGASTLVAHVSCQNKGLVWIPCGFEQGTAHTTFCFKPEHRKWWRWKRVTCELIGLESNSDGDQKDQGHQEYLRVGMV